MSNVYHRLYVILLHLRFSPDACWKPFIVSDLVPRLSSIPKLAFRSVLSVDADIDAVRSQVRIKEMGPRRKTSELAFRPVYKWFGPVPVLPTLRLSWDANLPNACCKVDAPRRDVADQITKFHWKAKGCAHSFGSRAFPDKKNYTLLIGKDTNVHVVAPSFAKSSGTKTHPTVAIPRMDKKGGVLGQSVESGHSFGRNGAHASEWFYASANDLWLSRQLLANNLVLLPMSSLTDLVTIPDSLAAGTASQGRVAVIGMVETRPA